MKKVIAYPNQKTTPVKVKHLMSLMATKEGAILLRSPRVKEEKESLNQKAAEKIAKS
jgi:hypothetical protein